MGREVRMVAADWQHPKDSNGRHIPLHENFPYSSEEIQEGLREGWLVNEPPFYGIGVMPQWSSAERTHWQMYQNVSEGTPISPVMPNAESLAEWLEANKANAGGGSTATKAEWLKMILEGYSPTLVINENGIMTGVKAS